MRGANLAGTTGFGQLLALLLVTLMVGYTEETMFRGILFFGSTERFTLLWGAIISAIIFGLFHYLNMIGGQGFGITTSQVVHAFSVGFMYASLRLMIGSLWPVILLHALWDFSILSMQSAMITAGGEVGAGLAAAQVGGVSISPIQVLPGLLYGAFVFWRWTVRSKKETA